MPNLSELQISTLSNFVTPGLQSITNFIMLRYEYGDLKRVVTMFCSYLNNVKRLTIAVSIYIGSGEIVRIHRELCMENIGNFMEP